MKKLTSKQLKKIEKLVPFTAHRIKLDENIYTMESGTEHLIDIRFKALLNHCGNTFRRKRVLDLACLEGGYSVAASSSGADEVVGIEIRQKNIDRCILVKEILQLKNVNFFKRDVNDIREADYGKFDVIICAGILYHMENPYSFLNNLYQILVPSGVMMIDTHVALRNKTWHNMSKNFIQKKFGSKTYYGKWFKEYNSDKIPEEIETFLWTSYRNPQSFILSEDSLRESLDDIGFKNISKIEMPLGVNLCPNHENCRIGLIVEKEKQTLLR